jgi:hypothetical protein
MTGQRLAAPALLCPQPGIRAAIPSNLGQLKE